MTEKLVINQGVFSFKNSEDFFRKIEKADEENRIAEEKKREAERAENKRKIEFDSYLITAEWLRSNNPEIVENHC
jgi:hypothetical protein